MNRENEIDKEIAALEQEKQDLKGRRKIRCLQCNRLTALKNATVVRTHWYTQPHGCTGGDYWNFGEYMFACGKCGKMSKAYIGSWEKDWKTKETKKKALKEPRVKLFKFIEDHINFVGELLDSYDGHDDDATIGDLREKKKKKEEDDGFSYY